MFSSFLRCCLSFRSGAHPPPKSLSACRAYGAAQSVSRPLREIFFPRKKPPAVSESQNCKGRNHIPRYHPASGFTIYGAAGSHSRVTSAPRPGLLIRRALFIDITSVSVSRRLLFHRAAPVRNSQVPLNLRKLSADDSLSLQEEQPLLCTILAFYCSVNSQ